MISAFIGRYQSRYRAPPRTSWPSGATSTPRNLLYLMRAYRGKRRPLPRLLHFHAGREGRPCAKMQQAAVVAPHKIRCYARQRARLSSCRFKFHLRPAPGHSEQTAKGEEKANRHTPAIKTPRKHMTIKEKTFSNRHRCNVLLHFVFALPFRSASTPRAASRADRVVQLARWATMLRWPQ